MTLRCEEEYDDSDGGDYQRKAWKERFALKAPKMEYVQALIELSVADGNVELTALLLELTRKIREGLIVYEDDILDTRKVGVKYDIENEFQRYGRKLIQSRQKAPFPRQLLYKSCIIRKTAVKYHYRYKTP